MRTPPTDPDRGRFSEAIPSSRQPIRAAVVTDALADPDRFEVLAVTNTGSTNADLAALPARGPAVIRVLSTEEQTAGRGRAGRFWACPPGAGLLFSARVSVAEVPPDRRGWIGALLGLAVVHALGGEPMVTANLKWPNDVLIGGAKCAGILAELVGEEVVVGAGINVSLLPAELPQPQATSLLLAGAASLDRERLLSGILNKFAVLIDKWRAAGGNVDTSGLRRAYRLECGTLGAPVRIELPGGSQITGVACDITADGAVVLRLPDGSTASYAAGDVVHLRRQD